MFNQISNLISIPIEKKIFLFMSPGIVLHEIR